MVCLFWYCCSVRFGESCLKSFLSSNGYQLLIRAHECVSSGASYGCDGLCLTIFSATNYCKRFANDGAAAHLYIHPQTGRLIVHTLVSPRLPLALPSLSSLSLCLSLSVSLCLSLSVCLSVSLSLSPSLCLPLSLSLSLSVSLCLPLSVSLCLPLSVSLSLSPSLSFAAAVRLGCAKAFCCCCYCCCVLLLSSINNTIYEY